MKITCSKKNIRRRNISAAEEAIDNEDVMDEDVEVGYMFEAEDVADLLSEVTGEEVEVDADPEAEEVTFTVGEDEYTVEPDNVDEVLEFTRVRGKSVAANRSVNRNRRPVSAATRRSRVVRRVSR